MFCQLKLSFTFSKCLSELEIKSLIFRATFSSSKHIPFWPIWNPLNPIWVIVRVSLFVNVISNVGATLTDLSKPLVASRLGQFMSVNIFFIWLSYLVFKYFILPKSQNKIYIEKQVGTNSTNPQFSSWKWVLCSVRANFHWIIIWECDLSSFSFRLKSFRTLSTTKVCSWYIAKKSFLMADIKLYAKLL